METRIQGKRGYPREISELQESVENAVLIHNAIVSNIATLDAGTAGWSQTSTSYTATSSYDYNNGDVTDVTRWNNMKTDIEAIESKLPALKTDLEAAATVLTDTIYGNIDSSTITSYTIPTFATDGQVPTINNWNDLMNEIQEVNTKLNRYYSFAYYLVDDVLVDTVTLPTGWVDSGITPTFSTTIPLQKTWTSILTKYNGSFIFIDFATTEVDSQTPTTKGRYIKCFYLDTDGANRAALIDTYSRTQLINIKLEGYATPSRTELVSADFLAQYAGTFGPSVFTTDSSLIYSIAFDSSNNLYLSVTRLQSWGCSKTSLSPDTDALIWVLDIDTYKYDASGTEIYHHLNKGDYLFTNGNPTAGGADVSANDLSWTPTANSYYDGSNFKTLVISSYGFEASNRTPYINITDLFITDNGTDVTYTEDTEQLNVWASGDSISASDFTISQGKFYWNDTNLVYYFAICLSNNAETDIDNNQYKCVDGTITAIVNSSDTNTGSSDTFYTNVSQYINYKNPYIGLTSSTLLNGATDDGHVVVSRLDLNTGSSTVLLNEDVDSSSTSISQSTNSLMFDSSTTEIYNWIKASWSESGISSYREYILEGTTQTYSSGATIICKICIIPY